MDDSRTGPRGNMNAMVLVLDGRHRARRGAVRAAARRAPVPLEPQAFDVLVYLVAHRDRVVPKEELMDAIWGGRFVSETAVTSRIKQVRRALGDDGQAQRVIRTVHGRGYRFVADVAETASRSRRTGPPPAARRPSDRRAPVRYTTQRRPAHRLPGDRRRATSTSC